jgi:GDPmannose 4,6-dehydratase
MKKKALITGVSGQDGAYLAKHLLDLGYHVAGLERRTASNENFRLKYLGIAERVQMLRVDMCDYPTITQIIQENQFDEVYNLAAQSFVGSSWDSPITTSNINSIAVTNLLDSIKRFSSHTKIYQASTSEMFGKIMEERQSEDTPFYPRSPYGVSKLYSHWMVANYRESYGMFACSGILFNHESPLRGGEFVTKKIVKRLCEIKKGASGVLALGNIHAKRDWGFAADYVVAMHMMLQRESPEDFVIGTGMTHSVKDFCNAVLAKLDLQGEWEGEGLDEKFISGDDSKVVIEISEEFFRPAEVDVLLANPSKARDILGWEATTSLDTLVEIMIDYELKANIGPR